MQLEDRKQGDVTLVCCLGLHFFACSSACARWTEGDSDGRSKQMLLSGIVMLLYWHKNESVYQWIYRMFFDSKLSVGYVDRPNYPQKILETNSRKSVMAQAMSCQNAF